MKNTLIEYKEKTIKISQNNICERARYDICIDIEFGLESGLNILLFIK